MKIIPGFNFFLLFDLLLLKIILNSVQSQLTIAFQISILLDAIWYESEIFNTNSPQQFLIYLSAPRTRSPVKSELYGRKNSGVATILYFITFFRAPRALYCFSLKNPIRRACIALSENKEYSDKRISGGWFIRLFKICLSSPFINYMRPFTTSLYWNINI